MNNHSIPFHREINTHYYCCSNLIRRTVSRRMDELISSDHTRREASSISLSMRRDIMHHVQMKLLRY